MAGNHEPHSQAHPSFSQAGNEATMHGSWVTFITVQCSTGDRDDINNNHYNNNNHT